MSRHVAAPHTDPPQTQLMANGPYAVMLTAAGAGYSRWRNLAVTRWREDAVRDENGSYVLLHDLDSAAVWSATWQPLARVPDRYEARFGAGQAQFERTDGTMSCTLAVAITGEGDGELRRVALRNDGDAPRSIELASWVELILGSASADAAHPAFSKMFVQTAQLDDGNTLLAWRRKRDTDDPDIFAAHLCTTEGASLAGPGFETDRARFIGRGRDLRRPLALASDTAEPGSAGTVLDPIFSLRRRVMIAPGTTVHLAFWTVLADSREAVLALVARCREPGAAERAIAATADAAKKRLTQAGLDEAAAERFQRLAAPLLYADSSWRAPPEQLARAQGGPPTLWAHAVSGDRPIVLVRVDSTDQLPLVQELLAAQGWWRVMQLAVDLVVVATAQGDAAAALAPALDSLGKEPPAQPAADKSAGALFVLRDESLSQADRDGLAAAARIVMDGRNGDLAAQLERVANAAVTASVSEPLAATAVGAATAAGAGNPPDPANAGASVNIDPFTPTPTPTPPPTPTSTPTSTPTPVPPDADRSSELEFFNGIGGFADNGREYEITLSGGRCTPTPWVNIVANAGFGFMVSAEGGGYTWAINSQTNPLTPWSNDATRDPPGDLLYLRDVDSGELWTATPEPIRAAHSYRICHGRGYSRFEHEVHGIAVELLQFVPTDDPVKISRLRIRNRSGRTRRLEITAYVQWALGAIGSTPGPFVTTARNESGALTARNAWRAEFAGTIAFADLGGRQTAWTCDRREFLGRQGELDRPAALTSDQPLAGRCGAGLDPCAVLQTILELTPDAQDDVVFLLGEGTDLAQAQALIARYRTADPEVVLAEATARWAEVCDAVQISTPDRRMDLLINGWLPYQVLSCRVHARTAFYQASGAWGFRDQLQDVLALTLSRPQVTRAHLLRAAARQFVEGDVQHWWLPPTGAGVRTHIADDRLWLPYAVAHYVETTGDDGVLDEEVAFLDGPPLPPGQVDNFFVPKASEQHGSLFEHCARALEASLAVGVHGLPLFGAGDWNDGMNRVGNEGRGESVWMGWFLHVALSGFAPLADARDEHERAEAWRNHAAALARALDAEAWDGEWWRRGWYDDGAVLGSHTSPECQIDSIAQSWGVISRAADGQRARRAMASLDRLLVRSDARLVELFTPPFDHTPLDPGYIKGYPPGIRENGGQYTHGAVWAVVAFAILGDGDRAAELYAMLNPISHSGSAAAIARYQVEPYVACADVYTAPDRLGRGGWTWYTGTAGWLYRAALEWLLGLRVRGATLRLEPCIPRSWPDFSITLRYRSARYLIAVENPDRVCRGLTLVELDGDALPAATDPVPLADDGATHRVRVVLG